MSELGGEDGAAARITRRELEKELRILQNEILHLTQALPNMARRIASIRDRLAIPAQQELELNTPAPEDAPAAE